MLAPRERLNSHTQTGLPEPIYLERAQLKSANLSYLISSVRGQTSAISLFHALGWLKLVGLIDYIARAGLTWRSEVAGRRDPLGSPDLGWRAKSDDRDDDNLPLLA